MKVVVELQLSSRTWKLASSSQDVPYSRCLDAYFALHVFDCAVDFVFLVQLMCDGTPFVSLFFGEILVRRERCLCRAIHVCHLGTHNVDRIRLDGAEVG